MVRDIMQKNEKVNPNNDLLKKLKALIPNAFGKDGTVDADAIRYWAEHAVGDKHLVVEERETFNFLGKDYARLLYALDTETVIVPDEENNKKKENKDGENIYLSGDNLEVLKHLRRSYEGQVKCIYIDPPYNTGSDDFVYNDSFDFTEKDLEEKLGIEPERVEKILKMKKRGSRSHAAWLTFMYPRLKLARDLLKDDGVIFISIDDNEQADLKILCDEIFGEENFVANIIIQSNKRGQTYKQLAKTHEYLLLYTKNDDTILGELQKGDGAFKKKDDVGDFEERELRNRNPKYGRFNRPNLFYPIYLNPNIIDENGYSPVSLQRNDDYFVEILPLNSEGEESCWRWGQKKFNSNCNEITMISDVVGRRKENGSYGCYEKYRKETLKAKTIWYEQLVGDLADEEDDIWEETKVITEQGSKELGTYDMGDVFDFPKPTYLLKKAFMIGTEKDSLCLDFFSGSASSFEALMALNADDSGKRRMISVQLPVDFDSIDKPNETTKNAIKFLDSINKPHTLDQIGMERIRRAAAKIKAEHPDATCDFGFKHYTIQKPAEKSLDSIKNFEPNPNFGTNTVLKTFGAKTVLATWMVDDGHTFNANVEKIDLVGYAAYKINDYLYLIDDGISDAHIKALFQKYDEDSTFKPKHLVLFGYSFGMTTLDTLKANIKNVSGIDIHMEIRY